MEVQDHGGIKKFSSGRTSQLPYLLQVLSTFLNFSHHPVCFLSSARSLSALHFSWKFHVTVCHVIFMCVLSTISGKFRFLCYGV